jgi:hypothetical protein
MGKPERSFSKLLTDSMLNVVRNSLKTYKEAHGESSSRNITSALLQMNAKNPESMISVVNMLSSAIILK